MSFRFFFTKSVLQLFITDCIQSLKSKVLNVISFSHKKIKIMSAEHKEQVTKILETMSKVNYFTKIKRDTIDNSFNVTLKVSGYSELNVMVSTLLKASIIMLNDDARSQATFSFNEADHNVTTLLEIALQLLPGEEMEVLDDLHKVYLEG